MSEIILDSTLKVGTP